MPKVTEEHIEARRGQIVDAAWECFARKGYHQSTMQDICQESGLSPGAIYRYFESKEAILKAINDRGQEMGRRIAEEARERARDEGPLAALDAIGEAMLATFRDPMFETNTRVNIECLPEAIRNEELRKGFRKELTFWRTEITELLSEARERGELRPEVDPEAVAVLLMCAFEGLRHYRLVDRQSFKPEYLVALVPALVAGRAATAARQAGSGQDGGKDPFGPPFGPRSEEPKGRTVGEGA